MAFTHANHYGEEYWSFVNGQHTTMGGHASQPRSRRRWSETVRNHFKKDYEAADIRQSIDAAIVVRVQEPVFESQTKDEARLERHGAGGPDREFIGKFMQQSLDVYLHKNRETAEAMKRKIEESERERKESPGSATLARERAKKASLHNRKLRDCRVHLGDRAERAEESTLFIVEGDSAAARSRRRATCKPRRCSR